MTWDHVDVLADLDADPDVMRYLGPVRTRAQVVASMPDRLSPSDDALGLGFWSGFAGGRFVGWWCLSLEGPGLAELGYRLTREAWGRGLASEGASALVRHGFQTVGLKRIVAETMAVNLGSRGVMARLNMRHLSTVVRMWEHPIPGAELGDVTYQITAAEWRAPRAASRPCP